MKELSGSLPEQVFCDRGYKGCPTSAKKDFEGKVRVHLAGKRGRSKALKRWMKRRNAIEPVIGHCKSDHRMDRNPLHGIEGDRIWAILCAVAFNMAKLLGMAEKLTPFRRAWRLVARATDAAYALISLAGLVGVARYHRWAFQAPRPVSGA